jgi:hypothetical protein
LLHDGLETLFLTRNQVDYGRSNSSPSGRSVFLGKCGTNSCAYGSADEEEECGHSGRGPVRDYVAAWIPPMARLVRRRHQNGPLHQELLLPVASGHNWVQEFIPEYPSQITRVQFSGLETLVQVQRLLVWDLPMNDYFYPDIHYRKETYQVIIGTTGFGLWASLRTVGVPRC